MRDIKDFKFRVWNPYEKTMNTDLPIIDLTIIRINGMKLMQFTGLKDRYGNPIYENDILLTDKGKRIKVVFSLGHFEGRESHGKPPYSSSIFFNYHAVIGNIYENPELLEKQNGQ